MSLSIDGRRKVSGQKSARTKPTWPTTLKADALTFKPASPPKSNPWTNFASKTTSELPSSDPPLSDPPLPSQAKSEEDLQLVKSSPKSEAAKSEVSGHRRRSGSIGSKVKTSRPASRLSWAEETFEQEPLADAASVSGEDDRHKGDAARTTSSSNPWFASSHPFLRKPKAKSEPPDLYSSDLPLRPISEAEGVVNQPEIGISSNNSKSTVLGSPLKNELSMVDEGVELEQIQNVDSVASESSSKDGKPAKASRPPSRDSAHSLTSADTARRTARSVSTSSEDSRRRIAATASAAQRGDER